MLVVNSHVTLVRNINFPWLLISFIYNENKKSSKMIEYFSYENLKYISCIKLYFVNIIFQKFIHFICMIWFINVDYIYWNFIWWN